MWNKKLKLLLIVIAILVIAGISITSIKQSGSPAEVVIQIKPSIGSITTTISTTGTVLPKNRLEIKPPVNGRIEQILIKEGDTVKTGQILAWMSSTERAALLDTARGKDEETLRYWEQVYKPIPLTAPIDAEVIVAKTQPGQTITTADAVVVLSDKLIIRAQVDETDIGKIKPGMKAMVNLDAYPDTNIKASVEHIYYESKTVNNVTIYEVDLVPDEVPQFFRSGMNATVDFIEKGKENALLIPVEAVHKENGQDYVLINRNNGKGPLKAGVTLGISDHKNVEVVSGITENDSIILKTQKYSLPRGTTGSNPFMPSRRR
jgi:macrolide-specific efflux system membrane fusion protein